MPHLDHEKLDVYRVAVEFADAAEEVAQEIPHGHGHVRDQLRRSSDSVLNNVAEGAGEFYVGEKARFSRMSCPASTLEKSRMSLTTVSSAEFAARTSPI